MRRIALGVILMLLVSPVAAGEADDAAKMATALFECSELARYMPEITLERERLLALGLKEGRVAGTAAMYPGGVLLDPVADANPDFWIGYALARASDDVESELQQAFPPELPDLGKAFAAQQQMASQEFYHRNCEMIGK
jgi:hypothetical protein